MDMLNLTYKYFLYIFVCNWTFIPVKLRDTFSGSTGGLHYGPLMVLVYHIHGFNPRCGLFWNYHELLICVIDQTNSWLPLGMGVAFRMGPFIELFDRNLNLADWMLPIDKKKRSVLKHIETKTKWPPFSRWHFRMHFLEWRCKNFDWDFTEVCSQGPNQQYSSIVSDNGLVPARR